MSEHEKMNCKEFRQLFRELEPSREPEPSREQDPSVADCSESDTQWQLHLLGCASCAEFYAGLRSQSLSRADEQKLRGGVFEQTLARREAIDSQLVEISSAEPPPELLAAVLAQTTHRPARHEAALEARWWAAIEKVFLRPRIALEASFVLTLVWMLAFGMPTDLVVSVASADQQMQQPLENSRRQLVELQAEVAVFVRETLQRDSQGEPR